MLMRVSAALIALLTILGISLGHAQFVGPFTKMKMVSGHKAAAGPAYSGPGNTPGGSGAVLWVGFRAYNAAYATGTNPAADINNTVTTQTFNILNTGYFDTAGATTFCSGHTCTISKLYDQTGNGHHFTGSTLPPLMFNALNTYACSGTWTGHPMQLHSASITQAQPFTIDYVAKRTAYSSGYDPVFGEDNTNTMDGFYTSGLLFSYSSNSLPTASATENVMHAVQNLHYNNSGTPSNSTITVDGTTTAGNLNTNSGIGVGGSNLDIGDVGGNPNSGASSSVICEVGLWPNDQTSNLAAMNSNMHAAYGGW